MPRSTLYTDFLHFVRGKNLFERGERVLAAVSGGPDSVAMFDLLRRFRDRGAIHLFVCHLDHGLRGKDARGDVAFVAGLAKNAGVPCDVARRNVRLIAKRRRISVETAAREARYEFFARCARKRKCTKVATAHTLSDNAETVLQRIVEGAGPKGLSGIPLVREIGGRGRVKVVRPLLFATRDEIERYIASRRLEARLDRTNLEGIYTRNRIRLEIMPKLKGLNPSIERSLVRMAESVAALSGCLEPHLEQAAGRIILARRGRSVTLDANALAPEHPAVAGEIVKAALLEILPDGRQLLSSHIDAVLDLALGESPSASTDLPCGFEARREYATIILGKRRARAQTAPFKARLAPGREVVLPEGLGRISSRCVEGLDLKEFLAKKSPREEVVDADALDGTLSVAFPKAGDAFRPLGGMGTKKLQDLFVDEKVPRRERGRIPVVSDDKGIMWVAGLRIADRVKATKVTTRYLLLRWQPPK